MKQILIILTAIILAGCQQRVTGPLPEAQGEMTPPIREVQETDWIKYTSIRHGYSFFYPPEWQASFYDESDQEILQGTHTITNYDRSQVEQYQVKGLVDWKAFMGEQPPLKLDISVLPLENNDFETTVKKYTEMAREVSATHGNQIGLEDTRVFEMKEVEGGGFSRVVMYLTRLDESLMILSRYGMEADDEEIQKSDEYDKFLGFLATFQFDSE